MKYYYKPQSTWMTNPITQIRNGQLYMYQNDHLGTPQRVIRTNGLVIWQADYEAFGEASVEQGLANQIENNLRFSGQYYDRETQAHYNYFRDYDPGLGRSLQSDPIGVLKSFTDPYMQLAMQMGFSLNNNSDSFGALNHLYSYASNSPLAKVDPFGLLNNFFSANDHEYFNNAYYDDGRRPNKKAECAACYLSLIRDSIYTAVLTRGVIERIEHKAKKLKLVKDYAKSVGAVVSAMVGSLGD